MCYLVSSLPPAASAGIRQQQMSMFTDEVDDKSPLEQARHFAASQLLMGHTDVKLWKLLDQPTLTQAVQWPKLGEEA